MSQQAERIWTMLVQAGLVEGPVPETAGLEVPWYVKALSAFSAWLAAVFTLGFIITAIPEIIASNAASAVVGAILIAGAYAILRRPRKAFLEHLALAVCLAGQALVIWAMIESAINDGKIPWELLALTQAALAVFLPGFILPLLSSFAAALAFSMSLLILGVLHIYGGVILFLAAWLWLNEFRYPRHMSKIRAIGYGLVLALFPINGTA
ncbi:MAG: DUF4401 domain-containing protein, partial [Alphaproteobacteria bacterium]|nr:DUF4401 domain-containing protein [Alphaproteobacteria bacterium]